MFDLNETQLDIDALEPIFVRTFGEASAKLEAWTEGQSKTTKGKLARFKRKTG